MQYNSLPSIPTFMSDLILLEDIVLPYNVIQEIHATDFPPTPVNVDLEHNLIKTLTNTSFRVNSTIVFLNLNDNPIVDISPEVFKKLPALKELRLQKSKLTRLPLKFPALTSLYFVDLTNSTELVCTCAEKSLESWVKSLSPANVVGSCGDTSIYAFFVTLSPACP
ncbi:unnamed protein product [Candidula unifasciata]|uniref:Uncharacterized protein n=1 Tax=Candidula unifasciata TaxID=100452 RepID=A0A8S3ZH95_9EUPU|nr:unnamed protein product [Candidula unifasciata]